MIFYEDEIVNEVYRTRAKLLDEYGGMEGVHKHMKEQRPLLEAQGWKFVSAEEVAAKKRQGTASANSAERQPRMIEIFRKL
jgi:hypothetical protein